MVPQQVSFVERSPLSQRVPYERFHCISLLALSLEGTDIVGTTVHTYSKAREQTVMTQ